MAYRAQKLPDLALVYGHVIGHGDLIITRFGMECKERVNSFMAAYKDDIGSWIENGSAFGTAIDPVHGFLPSRRACGLQTLKIIHMKSLSIEGKD